MQTERLIFRKFIETDGKWLHELDNDPDVMRYINGGIYTPHNFILKNILPLFRTYDSDYPGIGFWVLMEKNSEDPIGWCCLRRQNGYTNVASLGYRLAKQAWGHGYATEASKELVRVAFEELKLSTLIATTYEENKGSRGVLEKLGFQVFREFRTDLSEQATAYFESTDPWPGIDLEYRLERDG